MIVITASQMRELDRRATHEAGISAAVLMENAGRAVFEDLARAYGPLQDKSIAVFCGSGNNGGDGFVIARYLALSGAKPHVYCVGAQDKRSPEAQQNFVLLPPGCLADSAGKIVAGRAGPPYFLAIDALLGTGITRAPDAEYVQAITHLNEIGCPVVSVDIPSGVDATTGATPGAAVRATRTVTLSYPKLGLFLFPGADLVGRLHVADIGFSWASLQPPADIQVTGVGRHRDLSVGTASPSLITPDPWKKLLQKRPAESNKGDYGHVGILAGSRGMAGAPALTARAAQRAGAGLVTVLTAASAQAVLAGKLDEQMTLGLEEKNGAVSEAAWNSIQAFAEKATIFCIGPGLTTAPETVAVVRRMLLELNKPVILDADGLNALALDPDILRGRPDDPQAPLVLTPHPGEAARLLGRDIPAVQSDRVGAVRELAQRYRAIAVLKGRYTLIADPDGKIWVNTSGNPGMASGGMGDTLTGIIGALLARDIAGAKHAPAGRAGEDMSVAAPAVVALGVYIHGLAGDLAARSRGETGLTAGDVIAHLPDAFAMLAD